jgi:hypothetical protein
LCGYQWGCCLWVAGYAIWQARSANWPQP